MGNPDTRGDPDPGKPDVFDRHASRYDAWYDTALGAVTFAEELDALQPLLAGLTHPWLEVGSGSGRFSGALGAEVGVDPARCALALAAGRGVHVVTARAETLPFRDAAFGAVLFVTALCFVADPLAALLEARRVLVPDGRIVLGLILAEGVLGHQYQELALAGDPFYQRAHFFTRDEMSTLFASADLRAVRTRSALFHPPEGKPSTVFEGYDPTAGFTAMLVEVVSQ